MKKKKPYSLNVKQIIKYLFYKIHVLHHSLDSAHMNTHYLKVLSCAYGRQATQCKAFVLLSVMLDGCTLSYDCSCDSSAWVGINVLSTRSLWITEKKYFFIFATKSIYECFSRQLILGLMHKCCNVDYGSNDRSRTALQHHSVYW